EGHPLAPLLNPDGTLSFSAAYTVGDHYIGRNGISSGHRFLKNRTGAVASFMDNRLNLRGDFTFQTTDIASQQNRVQVPYSRFEGVIGYTGTNSNDHEDRRRQPGYRATNIYADYKMSLQVAHQYSFVLGYNDEHSRYSNLTARRNGVVYPDAQDINLARGQSIV